MCIIAYSKKGHKLISDETIKTMFQANPHGAGLMIKMKNGKTEWRKGFMRVDDFIKAIREFPDDREIALHMRIATDGEIVPANTHPFVVSNNMNDLRLLDGVGDMVLMHNGIIRDCQQKGGTKADVSDTMVFTSRVLYPIRNQLGNTYVQRLVQEYIGYSRLLVFRKTGPTVILGNWLTDKNGVYYSNGTFRKVDIGLHSNKKVDKAMKKAAYYCNGKAVNYCGYEIDDYVWLDDEYGYEEVND